MNPTHVLFGNVKIVKALSDFKICIDRFVLIASAQVLVSPNSHFKPS